MDAGLTTQLRYLEAQLAQLGYSGRRGKVVAGYEFVTGQGQTERADLIAFGDAHRWDISTACIAVRQCAGPGMDDPATVLRKLSYVGAPLAFFAYPEAVDVFTVAAEEAPRGVQPKATLGYGQLNEYLGQRRIDLAPRAVIEAKRGERQLSFFDVDPQLETFARNATRDTLVRQFASALESVPAEVCEEHSDAVFRLAIRILGARVLQDKLVHAGFAELATRDIRRLLEVLSGRFRRYFADVDEDVRVVGRETVQALYGGLGGEFTFRSLTNDMLAHFYETTLVDDAMRRRLGIYYTPQAITEPIMRRLPVEDLRRDERTVFDGTCGSGSLLLAAYERLSSLLPADEDREVRHQYLRERLWGLDSDAFAVEVAQLSLLLLDLPMGDDWRIDRGDVFRRTPRQLFGDAPNIIVGNPPFSEPNPRGGGRSEMAAQVLSRYVEWLAPGGLLGVVVPRTFLHKASGSECRRLLMSMCEMLEVWHLPEGAIPGSGTSTAVILARKLSAPAATTLRVPVRVHEGHRRPASFDTSLLWRGTTYLVSQERWQGHDGSQMVSSAFDDLWDRIEANCEPIHPTYGIVQNGVQVGSVAATNHFWESPLEGTWRRVLHRNPSGSDVLEPFSIQWDRQPRWFRFLRYPSDEIRRGKNPTDFDVSAKVVVNASRNSRNPWRLYAAVDRERLVVTENFYYILPTQEASAEELAAVLNSAVASLWYDGRNYQWNIISRELKRVPFPHFEDEQRREMRALVPEIEREKRSPAPRWEAVRGWVARLDEIVFDAYGIGTDERSRLVSWVRQFRRPGREWRVDAGQPETPPTVAVPARRWRLSGEVEAVDLHRGSIVLSLQGHPEPVEVRVPPTMPGWALRPGAAFVATIPWEQREEDDLSRVCWIEFEPLDFGYLSNEELLSLLE